MIQAASIGAGMAASAIAIIIVNIIAFMALIEFINQSISYFGGRLGYAELNFQVRKNLIGNTIAQTSYISVIQCFLYIATVIYTNVLKNYERCYINDNHPNIAQHFDCFTSRPGVCQCPVVQITMDNMSKYKHIKIHVKNTPVNQSYVNL